MAIIGRVKWGGVAFFLFSFLLYGEPVIYSGFSFSGRAEDQTKTFPYLSQIAAEKSSDGTAWLDWLFRGLIWGNRELLTSIDLKAGSGSEAGSLKALAFAMTGERVSIEPVAGVYKCCINLSGQILILDYKTMMIVGSYPIVWEIIHVFNDAPKDADICALLQGSQNGLQSEFFKKPIIDLLPHVAVKDYSGRNLRILKVEIGDEALPFLSESCTNNQAAFKASIAEQCGAYMSSNLGLALLPYVKDSANGKMTLAFSNSEIVMFTIPEPTYGISIRLDKFKKVSAKETLSERLLVYGAYVTLKLYEPQFGTVYYENPTKIGVPKTVPMSQTYIDDFSVFQEALKNVLQKSAEEAMADKQARKVLEKCKRS